MRVRKTFCKFLYQFWHICGFQLVDSLRLCRFVQQVIFRCSGFQKASPQVFRFHVGVLLTLLSCLELGFAEATGLFPENHVS
ncbi:MAG: hypothetical protein BHW33_04295 [Firmicutes bacterium CAG:137_57_8]|nr:MAG: hypothetical protein BHW33_04295 [Firmicutes bacterium CAG:137_57_8]